MTTDTSLDRYGEFEQVAHFRDDTNGLDGLIAIHSTVLGPALGGVRFRRYRSGFEARNDALRLARGMTYKAAVAGLDLGGGKAVIDGDPGSVDRVALFRAFGEAVESLGGRYITAEDVGTTVEDMVTVAKETGHVVGLPESKGGLGDPSPSTALGVLASMKATLAFLDGGSTLVGRTIAVCGLGKVGAVLARMLVEEGAAVAVADVDGERVTALADQLGVKGVEVDDIHRISADVFAPCALGGILTSNLIRELDVQAVVGAANNQLATPSSADLLAGRGIAYVPDFVANAGGLIHVAWEAKASLADVQTK
ncbi:MAG: leucine dehydrogenase, partial [Acidimicrobiaceae bacterium]|nr:leucine dehydrogenase [Acidimicrobiaceae bacterium]